MQTVIGEIEADAQNCLFMNDRAVAALRASVFLTNRDSFERGAERFLEKKVVMRVPGLGTYYGREDALEYAQIMSNPKFNGDYHGERGDKSRRAEKVQVVGVLSNSPKTHSPILQSSCNRC